MKKTEILISFLEYFFVRTVDEDDDVAIKTITANKAGYKIVTQHNIHNVAILRSATDRPCINWNHTIYQYIDGTWVPVCTLGTL